MIALRCSVLQLLLLLLTGTGTAVLLVGAALTSNADDDHSGDKDQNAVPASTVEGGASSVESHSGPAPASGGNVGQPAPATRTGASPAAALPPVDSPVDSSSSPSADSAVSSSSSAAARQIEGAAATGHQAGTQPHERARSGDKKKSSGIWKRIQQYKLRLGRSATQAGAESGAPELPRAGECPTRTTSDPHSTESDPRPRSSSLMIGASRLFSKRSSRQSSWRLTGNLAEAPPLYSPSLFEFAAALHEDLPTIFQNRVDAARAGSMSSSQSPCSIPTGTCSQTHSSVRRHSLSSGDRKPGLFGSRLRGGRDRSSSPLPGDVTSTGSGASLSRRSFPGGSMESDERRRGAFRGTRSTASSFDSDQGASGDLRPPVVGKPESFTSAMRLPYATCSEQQLISTIIVAFITKRSHSRGPPQPPIPPAVEEAAQRRMSNPERMRYFVSAGELGMTGGETHMSQVPRIWTTAYVFPRQSDYPQAAYMRRELTKYRGLCWAMSKIDGGSLRPWEVAALYNLHLPLDVASVEGEGPLLPEGDEYVTVNAFVTREVLLSTLDEILRLRPTDRHDERGAWHLVLLSLSVQVIYVLGRLSEAGVSLNGIDGSNLALSASGSLLVTSIEPKTSVPEEDARTVSRLLFRIWCRQICSSSSVHPESAHTSPREMCSPRLPHIVSYAVRSLGEIDPQRHMTLQELLKSTMFRDLARSLAEVARGVQQEAQAKEATLVEGEQSGSRA